MLFRQNIVEFTNLKETFIRRNNHFRVEIWYKRKNLGPRGLNQIKVGINYRHVILTFNRMSHEITYTGPLIVLNY